MIKDIHQSMLNMATRCGEQFRRRYIEGEIGPPGIAAGRGTGLHKANEVNMSQKISSGKDIELDTMLDAARDGFVKSFLNGIFLPGENAQKKGVVINTGLNDCLTLTKLYAEKVAPAIQPISTEREFCVDIGLSLPIAGRIDNETEVYLHDLKTAGKSWAENQIEKEIQPVMYSLAKFKETGKLMEFKYDILVNLKTPKVQPQTITPTEKTHQKLINKIVAFIAMLDSGVFMPANPASWWCSPDWCFYYRNCKFV